MDRYDCEQIDKEMSRRIDAIYTDPAKHKFYSCFDAYNKEWIVSKRGKKIRGKKTICFYCGKKKKGHAEVTEDL